MSQWQDSNFGLVLQLLSYSVLIYYRGNLWYASEYVAMNILHMLRINMSLKWFNCMPFSRGHRERFSTSSNTLMVWSWVEGVDGKLLVQWSNWETVLHWYISKVEENGCCDECEVKAQKPLKGSCVCSHIQYMITRGRQSLNRVIWSNFFFKRLGSISVYPTPSDNFIKCFVEEKFCHGNSKACLMWVGNLLGFFLPYITISRNWHFAFLFQELFILE
jgi:hypothetical protein